MILYIIMFLLGILVGAVSAGVYFNLQKKKADQKKQVRREKHQQKIQEARKESERIRQQEALRQKDKQGISPAQPEKQEPAVPQKPPEQSAEPRREAPRETEEQRRKRIYRDFQCVKTLELRFQYAFPDSLLFLPGSGYLCNGENQVIPEEKVLSQVNNAKGYAMDGLFRVFDVVYRDKTYTFQQIMDGEMGNSYVRIKSLLAPARICHTGHFDNYELIQKGKLEVTSL